MWLTGQVAIGALCGLGDHAVLGTMRSWGRLHGPTTLVAAPLTDPNPFGRTSRSLLDTLENDGVGHEDCCLKTRVESAMSLTATPSPIQL